MDLKELQKDLDRVRGLAEEFATIVRSRFDTRLRAIKLFGSAARGDWTRESDIDVLVLLDRVESADTDWIVSRAYSLGLIQNNFLLQPTIMPQAEFDRLLNQERLFARGVAREGIDL